MTILTLTDKLILLLIGLNFLIWISLSHHLYELRKKLIKSFWQNIQKSSNK